MVLTKENYTTEIQRLLDDTTTYKPLIADPIANLKAELSLWVNKGIHTEILDTKEANYLIPRAPRSQFYI